MEPQRSAPKRSDRSRSPTFLNEGLEVGGASLCPRPGQRRRHFGVVVVRTAGVPAGIMSSREGMTEGGGVSDCLAAAGSPASCDSGGQRSSPLMRLGSGLLRLRECFRSQRNRWQPRTSRTSRDKNDVQKCGRRRRTAPPPAAGGTAGGTHPVLSGQTHHRWFPGAPHLSWGMGGGGRIMRAPISLNDAI